MIRLVELEFQALASSLNHVMETLYGVDGGDWGPAAPLDSQRIGVHILGISSFLNFISASA